MNLQWFIILNFGRFTMNRKITFFIALIFVLQGTQFVQADDHDNDQTIVDVASGTGSHESLVAALNHVSLADTLAGEGPFTVFAPTDQAFTDAGVDLDDYDTDAENETLKDILLYHVISGAAVDAANVTDGMTADSYPFEHAFLSRVATRIINEVRGINRVTYDVTSKPPGTIEWE